MDRRVYFRLNRPLINVSRYTEASPWSCALYLIGTGRVWEKRGVLPEVVIPQIYPSIKRYFSQSYFDLDK
jgi:hypothetical protein